MATAPNSAFKAIPVVFSSRPDLSGAITEDYRDSFQYRLGAERTLSDTWAVRGGYFWDETPAPPASVSPLLPDADRNGFCLGGSWRSGSVRIDAASWLVLARDRSTAGLNRDGFEGTYKSRAFTVGIFVGYVF